MNHLRHLRLFALCTRLLTTSMVSSVLTLGPPKSTKASGTAESTSISYHFRLEVGLIDRRRPPYRYYWNRGGEPGGYLSAVTQYQAYGADSRLMNHIQDCIEKLQYLNLSDKRVHLYFLLIV